MIGLTDYLQWYLVDISSLFKMVERLFSIEVKGSLEEASGQLPNEPEFCSNSLWKIATECPDTPWVSCVTTIICMYVYSETSK